MDKAFLFLIFGTASAVVAGCARLPKHTTISYYLPVSRIDVKVDRTIGCDADDHVLIANDVQPAVISMADLTAKQEFDLSNASATVADSDVTFTFTDDGRLLSVNSTSTGIGGPIIKSLASIAQVVGVALMASANHEPLPDSLSQFHEECNNIRSANNGSPLVLTYFGSVSKSTMLGTTLKPETASVFYDSKLRRVLGLTKAEIVDTKPLAATVSVGMSNTGRGKEYIHARAPDLARLQVTAGIGPDANKMSGGFNFSGIREDVIYNDWLLIAGSGEQSSIPVTKPALFGKKTLVANFSQIGAVTSLRYVTNPGTGDGTEAASATLSKVAEFDVAKTAAMDAERASIVASQKLMACKTHPTECE